MSDITLDCKGLPCPQPVLKCKDSVERDNPEKLIVVVDNDPARENVTRFLTLKGYCVTYTGAGSEFTVTAVRSDDGQCPVCETMSEQEIADLDNQKILVFIASDVIGSGDDELGGSLMYNFISTLPELGPDLWRVILVNGGVKLAIKGHKCEEGLKKLVDSGVSLLVCGTCLEFFGLTDSKSVGQTTNMLDVVTSFQLASKTIRV
ncbi:MAG: sulfurtransferase-like selenium metabolism protein YedF [Desulfovibrionaceae bacterium]|nr:sulfurtransferase-like selenium metabolism protein YedF [Desulfovibrionaceae bacterium]